MYLVLGRLKPAGTRDLIAYAVEDKSLTTEELEQLEQLIREQKERRHAGKRSD